MSPERALAVQPKVPPQSAYVQKTGRIYELYRTIPKTCRWGLGCFCIGRGIFRLRFKCNSKQTGFFHFLLSKKSKSVQERSE